MWTSQSDKTNNEVETTSNTIDTDGTETTIYDGWPGTLWLWVDKGSVNTKD